MIIFIHTQKCNYKVRNPCDTLRHRSRFRWRHSYRHKAHFIAGSQNKRPWFSTLITEKVSELSDLKLKESWYDYIISHLNIIGYGSIISSIIYLLYRRKPQTMLITISYENCEKTANFHLKKGGVVWCLLFLLLEMNSILMEFLVLLSFYIISE